jgi:phosphoglycerate dehydrogenase-like enzyme
VSLHTPLLPETRGLIGREHFAAMKPGATFINTSRGEIVREADLIETFSRRTDLTAVLDVTSPEPPVEGSPLYTLPNVVLTPHIAGSTGRECRRMGETMIAEFDRWTAGSPLQCQVTQAQAALMA